MKGFLKIVLIALFSPLIASADNYKILNMNSATIKIGDRVCKTGDEFSDQEIEYIQWTHDKQAIKVQNTTSKTIHLLVGQQFKNGGAKTIKDFFVKKKHLSTRGMSLKEMENYLTDEFMLLDSISVESNELTDKQHFFVMSYKHNGKKVRKRLMGEDGEFIIDRTLFDEELSVPEVTASILYVNTKIRKKYLITEAMKIVLLPSSIDD